LIPYVDPSMSDESIFNLIPEPFIPDPKQPMYRSKFPGTVAGMKKPAATMGIPHTVVETSQFLKKGTAVEHRITAPAAVGIQRRDAGHAKAPVPRRDEKPVMGLISQKNFVTANAVDNILSVPKKTSNPGVDYLQKQDYGKVPAYLTRVKEQIKDEYGMIEEMQQRNQPSQQEAIDVLTDGDRQLLLAGLKANWEAVNKEYQTLSFTLDTPAKKKRKEDYEAQLEQIEKDIQKLTKKFVFVHNDY
jgi:hypothetical protein